MIELVLYSKRDCELCREMEELLASELSLVRANVERVEIDGDPDLQARFGAEVPVLFVNGRKAFKFRVGRRQLRRRLAREARA
ncbi:MAG: glutaredoxin family protein [Candidatus Binataceae bacterium]